MSYLVERVKRLHCEFSIRFDLIQSEGHRKPSLNPLCVLCLAWLIMEIDGAQSVRASQLEIALIVYGSTMRPDPTRSRSPLVLLLGSSLSHRVLRAASFVNFTRCSILFLSVPLSSLPFGIQYGETRPIFPPNLPPLFACSCHPKQLAKWWAQHKSCMAHPENWMQERLKRKSIWNTI